VAAELRQVSLEMPDACERLEYVGKMTERAANRVLESSTRPSRCASGWSAGATSWWRDAPPGGIPEMDVAGPGR
jgi:hypothetical protein